MADKPKPEDHVPWYLRIKTLIITAGGLAAAIISIITLANVLGPKENTNDEASIESVTRVRTMTLSEFQTEKLGGDLPLRPDPSAASQGRFVGGMRDAVELEEPSPSMPAPKPTASPPDTPSKTPRPTDTPTPSPTPGTNETLALKMRTDPRLAGHGIRFDDLRVLAPTHVPIIVSEPGDPGASDNSTTAPTEALSPDEVVEKLLIALAEVEGGDPANLNPQGYLYVVDLAIKGHVGERLKLTYSLNPIEGGSEVPESWRATNLAYYMTPTTQNDSGVAEIWIPDLVAPGPYAVNAELRLVAENLLVDSETSAEIEE